MIRLAAVACALMLSACATQQPPIRAKTPAIAVSCAAQCTTTCLPAEWPQWTGDPDSPQTWDELPTVTADMRVIAEQCDTARASCVACLSRIESVGIVCGISEACK